MYTRTILPLLLVGVMLSFSSFCHCHGEGCEYDIATLLKADTIMLSEEEFKCQALASIKEGLTDYLYNDSIPNDDIRYVRPLNEVLYEALEELECDLGVRTSGNLLVIYQDLLFNFYLFDRWLLVDFPYEDYSLDTFHRSQMSEVMNGINISRAGVKVLLSEDTSENVMLVNTRLDVYVNSIPRDVHECAEYIKDVIYEVVVAAKTFDDELYKLYWHSVDYAEPTDSVE